MMNLLRRWRASLREQRNRSLVTHSGAGTQLSGVIDRRASDAIIKIGSGCLIDGHLVVERNDSRIEIGDNVLIGGDTVVDCALSIVVESDVLISYQCIIADSDNHSIYPEWRVNDLRNWKNGRRHDWSRSAMEPIRIERGAWIGARSIILKGVTIGAGSIVGMGSVVTRDVPPRVIVAGNPARVIREIGQTPAGGSISTSSI